MKWIDTHAHYDMPAFDGDRDEVFEKIKEAGVGKIICPAVGYDSNRSMMSALSAYPDVFFGVGIHPKYILTGEQRSIGLGKSPKYRDLEQYLAGAQDILQLIKGQIAEISELAEAYPRVVAVGETGLDYSCSPGADEMALQSAVFRMHIEMALKQNLPLILHVRDEHEDALGILKSYNTQFSGVIHCFRGGVDCAGQYTDLGFMLGIGTSLLDTRFPELTDVIGNTDMEKIVLETDAPYLKPDILIGERNTSISIPLIAERIAEIRGISVESVAELTYDNSERVFGLSS